MLQENKRGHSFKRVSATEKNALAKCITSLIQFNRSACMCTMLSILAATSLLACSLPNMLHIVLLCVEYNYLTNLGLSGHPYAAFMGSYKFQGHCWPY